MSTLTGDMNINVEHGHLDRYKIDTLLRGHTDERPPPLKRSQVNVNCYTE